MINNHYEIFVLWHNLTNCKAPISNWENENRFYQSASLSSYNWNNSLPQKLEQTFVLQRSQYYICYCNCCCCWRRWTFSRNASKSTPWESREKKTQWKDNNIENIIFKFHIILCQQFKGLPQFPLFYYSVTCLRQSLHRNKQANLVCQWTLLGIIWLVI